MVTINFGSYSFFKKIGLRYNEWNKNHPMKSSICNAMVVMTTGDCLIQYVDHLRSKKKKFKYDLERGLTVMSFAVIFQGPIFCIWYRTVLPKIAPINEASTKLQQLPQLLKKVFYEETINSWMMITTYLGYVTYLKTRSIKKCEEKIQEDGMRIWKADLSVWPAVQMFTFGFVPIHLQPLIVNVCGVFWSAYTSYVNFG